MIKAIPWNEAITAAPVIAQNAKKLWDKVGRRKEPSMQGERMNRPDFDFTEEGMRGLVTKIAELEEAQQSSALLIHELAEQNKMLFQHVEHLHRKLKFTFIFLISVVLGAGLVWFYWLK